MGSVIDYEECTQCGGVYYIDYKYRTGSEDGICHSCGKSHHVSLLFSEDNQVMLDENGYWKYERREKSGFGACTIMSAEGHGLLLTLSENPSTEEIDELLLSLKAENVDPERSYLCVWDSEKQQLNNLFGSPPNYADDFCGENVSEPEHSSEIDTEFNDDLLPF